VYYVVVIETEDGKKDHKVFRSSGDAVKRYHNAVSAQISANPVRIGLAEPTVIVSCDLYKTDTRELREAVQLVKDGRADKFKPFGVPSIDDL
jgi:hypothetical protein